MSLLLCLNCNKWWLLCTTAALIVVALAGCAETPEIPVTGTLAGHRIETTVDSESARYYLADYLASERKRPALDTAIGRLHERWPQPTPALLGELSERYSVDFAALYFMQYLTRQPRNRRFREAFRSELDTGGADANAAAPGCPRCLVLLAPGWLYRSQPETGADFARERRILERLGIDHQLIETEDSGTITENAAIIADAIQRRSENERPLILVSASKAGPEVALALDQLQRAGMDTSVAAWINIGGILRGSPLADWALAWPQYPVTSIMAAFEPWTLASVQSMTTARNRDRFASLELPPDLLIVNYAAAPLSGQISTGAEFGYNRIRPHGPNDGLTLLPEALAPPGVTLLAIGQDHYFLGPARDRRTVAMLRVLLNRTEQNRNGAQWAPRNLKQAQ